MTFSTLIAPAALAAAIKGDAPLVVVDLRHDLAAPAAWGEDQYRTAHIPGAVFAHLDRDLSGAKTGRNGRHPLPRPEAAAALFGRLGITAGTQVVAYDQGSGIFASRLWWMLRWLGHDAVAVLDGGFARWTQEARPMESGGHAPSAADFDGHVSLPVADVAMMEANLDTGGRLVIDARARERFRGDIEPLDTAAGHIPGARNRPSTLNLGPDGRFKSPSALRAEWEDLLDGRDATAAVHQCGSGVSACHNLLALAHAGLPGGILYPGSWSEWSADPRRPVARGD